MNENLNLLEILRNCPKGTKLYSTVHGDVYFREIRKHPYYPITVTMKDMFNILSFTSDGKMFTNSKGECVLFPSREQRDWGKFKHKKPKFDPNTLNPFDKVLARNYREDWNCLFFSHIIKDEDTYPYACGSDMFNGKFTYCIPYNDETKHLVGRTDEAPEFYRFWED